MCRLRSPGVVGLFFLLSLFLAGAAPFFCPQVACAQSDTRLEEGGGQSPSLSALVEEQLEALDLRELEELGARLEEDARLALPELDVRRLVRDPGLSRAALDPGRLMKGLVRYLFRELLINLRLLGQLVVLAVLLAVLQSMQGALGERSFGDLVFAGGFLVLILLGIQSFIVAAGYTRQALADMTAVMQALLPLLSALLLAAGGTVSVALLHPVVYGVLPVLSGLINQVVLPLLFLSVALGLVGNLSQKFPLSRLAGLARQLSVGFLGLCFSALLGTLLVRGVAGPVADGVSIRAGKFLAATFIPVVGKMFSDAVEIVVGTSLLVKNALGLVGIALLVGYCAFPIVKITALYLVYRLVNALVQPVSDPRFTDALGHLESSLLLLAVAVGVVGLIFFLAIGVMVGVGSLMLAAR
ncbi:MAG: stage III sporulation protein AE [Bacillota bacterium]|nr:stage III sporulation protein AE [Bacillota bacterium]